MLLAVEPCRADGASTDVVGAYIKPCRADGPSTDVVGASVESCSAGLMEHPLML
jgi:hypothetical protein